MASDRDSTALKRVGAVVSPVLVLLAVMWLVEIVDVATPLEPDQYGIQSRTLPGLVGILFAPFLHVDFAHLWTNSVVFLVLGSLVAWRSQGGFWTVTATIVVLGGLGVWIFGPSLAVTIGASGLIFGYLAYLLVAGLVTRHWADIGIGIAVLVLYGGLLWAVLPTGVPSGVSWLGHLTGALAGGASALWFAKRPAAQPKTTF